MSPEPKQSGIMIDWRESPSSKKPGFSGSVVCHEKSGYLCEIFQFSNASNYPLEAHIRWTHFVECMTGLGQTKGTVKVITSAGPDLLEYSMGEFSGAWRALT